MKLSKILITALFMLIFSSIFAYIPENTEENQFVPKILGKSAEVSKLVDDGIKAVRQEVVSSTYKTNNQGSLIKDRNSPKLVEENTTTTEVLYYEPKDPRSNSEKTFCLVNTEVFEGEFWGEDYVFCRRAREAGIEIWIDPYIQFDHDGTIGMFQEVLTAQKPEPVPAE